MHFITAAVLGLVPTIAIAFPISANGAQGVRLQTRGLSALGEAFVLVPRGSASSSLVRKIRKKKSQTSRDHFGQHYPLEADHGVIAGQGQRSPGREKGKSIAQGPEEVSAARGSMVEYSQHGQSSRGRDKGKNIAEVPENGFSHHGGTSRSGGNNSAAITKGMAGLDIVARPQGVSPHAPRSGLRDSDHESDKENMSSNSHDSFTSFSSEASHNSNEQMEEDGTRTKRMLDAFRTHRRQGRKDTRRNKKRKKTSNVFIHPTGTGTDPVVTFNNRATRYREKKRTNHTKSTSKSSAISKTSHSRNEPLRLAPSSARHLPSPQETPPTSPTRSEHGGNALPAESNGSHQSGNSSPVSQSSSLRRSHVVHPDPGSE